MIQTTKHQILSHFTGEEHDTQLCDFPASYFVTGGAVTNACRDAGYNESGRKVVNNQNAWNMTVEEWAGIMGI